MEELLRFDPPAQFIRRKALEDIDIAGVRIPKGAMMVLLAASGNRDPKRFTDPDRFDPERKNNQNFGFGAGLHACLGAWLARMETEAALVALSTRLINPSLAEDPPPYRSTALVRGPERLLDQYRGRGVTLAPSARRAPPNLVQDPTGYKDAAQVLPATAGSPRIF